MSLDAENLLCSVPISTRDNTTRGLAIFWYPLSYRDLEDQLAERGIDVSYETVRRWALKFGQTYAQRLQDSAPSTRRPVAP